MKLTPQTGRHSYHIRPSGRRRLPPKPPFRERRTAAPDFDSACWIEAANGAAVEIGRVADHRGDLDE